MTSDNPILITCVGVDHDLDMFPHFLRHYLDLGVRPENIYPVLNTRRADAAGLAEAQGILTRAGVPEDRIEIWVAPYTSDSMWEKRREVQHRLCGPQDWVISADVDEFHFYPEPLEAFLARCDAMKVDCVQGVFVDRMAADGSLAPVREEPGLLEQFPVEAEVTRSIAGRGASHGKYGTLKMMCFRGDVMPARGGHHPIKGQDPTYLYHIQLAHFPDIESPEYRFSVPTRVAHVHWTAGLSARLRERLATPGVSAAGAEYGRKQLEHFERHEGVALDQVALASSNGPGDCWPGDWEKSLARMRAQGRQIRLKAAIRNKLSGVKHRITGAFS